MKYHYTQLLGMNVFFSAPISKVEQTTDRGVELYAFMFLL